MNTVSHFSLLALIAVDATDCFLLFQKLYLPATCMVLYCLVFSSIALMCYSFSNIFQVFLFLRFCPCPSPFSYSPVPLLNSFIPMASFTHLVFNMDFPPALQGKYLTYNGNLYLEVPELPQIPNCSSFCFCSSCSSQKSRCHSYHLFVLYLSHLTVVLSIPVSSTGLKSYFHPHPPTTTVTLFEASIVSYGLM